MVFLPNAVAPKPPTLTTAMYHHLEVVQDQVATCSLPQEHQAQSAATNHATHTLDSHKRSHPLEPPVLLTTTALDIATTAVEEFHTTQT